MLHIASLLGVHKIATVNRAHVKRRVDILAMAVFTRLQALAHDLIARNVRDQRCRVVHSRVILLSLVGATGRWASPYVRHGARPG